MDSIETEWKISMQSDFLGATQSQGNEILIRNQLCLGEPPLPIMPPMMTSGAPPPPIMPLMPIMPGLPPLPIMPPMMMLQQFHTMPHFQLSSVFPMPNTGEKQRRKQATRTIT